MDARLHIKTDLELDAFALNVDHIFDFDGISALFGPSGSGKTTLLRIIAGLQAATGLVKFGDHHWLDGSKSVAPHLRDVSYVFQDARLFPHLDVRGNISFARPKAPIDDVVDALDLGALLPRRVHDLSGGERQRVALGRALIAAPKLLLLDEPLGALDRRRKLEILPYIDRLATEFKVPTLFVSHSIEEVSRLASHVTLLEAGRVVASGPVDEMQERADFQILTGRFEAGSTVRAEVVEHHLDPHLTEMRVSGQPIVMPMLEGLAIGQRVPLRLRARDVAIALEPVPGISIRNQLKGVIVEIQEESASAFAEVLVDIGGSRIRARLTRAAISDLGLRNGLEVVALIKSVAFDRRGLMGG